MSQRGFLKLPPGSSLSCWPQDKPVAAHKPVATHIRERLAPAITRLLGLTTAWPQSKAAPRSGFAPWC